MFYNAIGRMNRFAALVGPSDPTAARELAKAYHELEDCSKYLNAAVQRGRGRQAPDLDSV